MKMKRTLALVLTIAICATMALGGTLAFLTDTEEKLNIMTVGRVDIDLIEQQRTEVGGDLEDFADGKQLLPMPGSAQGDKDKWGLPIAKNYVDKIVNVYNKGNTPAYVRVIVGVPADLEGDTANKNALHWNVGNRFTSEGNYDGKENPGYADIAYAEHLRAANVDGEDYNVYVFTYKTALEPKTQTKAAAFVGFYLDGKVDWDDETGKYYLGDAEIDYDLSQGVMIPVVAQAVQADGFNSAEEAFASSGLPTIPWEDTDTFGQPVVVRTVDELNAAVAAGKNILLDEDLEITEQIVLNGSNLDGGPSHTIQSEVSRDAKGNTVPAVLATEGVVENLQLYGAGRGVGTRGSLTGDLTVRSYTADNGSYALHVGSGNGYSLLVEDSFLNGWVSYGKGFSSVTFNNVYFAKNSTPSDFNGIRAYSNTTFVSCEFEGVTLDVDGEATAIVLENCTINGVAITKDNLAALLADDTEVNYIVIK